jgi:chromatin assembly factor 1 subunit A
MKQLMPVDDGEDDKASTATSAALPLSVLEAAINAMATRVNYGLDNPSTGGRMPAAYHAWRWEVKHEHRDWLPKSLLDKVDARMAERVQVCTL